MDIDIRIDSESGEAAIEIKEKYSKSSEIFTAKI